MAWNPRLSLALMLMALYGCQEQPCAPDQTTCEPAARGELTLTHGRLVLTAGHAADDTHAMHGALTTGRVASRAGDLRLIGTLTD